MLVFRGKGEHTAHMINNTEFQQFTIKLFKYLDKRFGAIEARLDQHDTNFDQLQSSVDALYGKVDNLDVEYFAVKKQLDRYQDWIDRASNNKLQLS